MTVRVLGNRNGRFHQRDAKTRVAIIAKTIPGVPSPDRVPARPCRMWSSGCESHARNKESILHDSLTRQRRWEAFRAKNRRQAGTIPHRPELNRMLVYRTAASARTHAKLKPVGVELHH